MEQFIPYSNDLLIDEELNLNISESDLELPYSNNILYNYFLFNSKLTDDILRNNTNLKLSKGAKNLFSKTISSIGDEIMVNILLRTRNITEREIQDTFINLELPFIVSSNNKLPISKLLKIWRQKIKFNITINAKMVLKSSLKNLMIEIAKSIHKCRNSTLYTITENDVRQIVEIIVVIKDYEKKTHKSRSVHAKERKRNKNGRF